MSRLYGTPGAKVTSHSPLQMGLCFAQLKSAQLLDLASGPRASGDCHVAGPCCTTRARDRDPSVALQSPPWSQASPRGEAKDSTLFSSRDRYLLEPTEWSLLCRRALVFISLYISEHRHSVCMLLHTQNIQGIFPTQGWNTASLLLHCRWVLYH